MGVTVVTGASSGIGRSLARRLARRGATVALIARHAEPLVAAAAEIREAGGKALAVPCDVTDPEQVRRAITRVEAELGPVDRLIANAGGGQPTFVDRFDAAEVEAVLRVNLMGTVNCIEAVLPGMLARQRGHLVAMGSLVSYRGLPTAAAYSAAKAALTNFMESLRIDLRGRGVSVSLLQPGFVQTKPHKPKRMRMDLEAATRHMERAILARRPVTAFPWTLSLAFSIISLLPAPIYDRLLSGRGRSPNNERR